MVIHIQMCVLLHQLELMCWLFSEKLLKNITGLNCGIFDFEQYFKINGFYQQKNIFEKWISWVFSILEIRPQANFKVLLGFK